MAAITASAFGHADRGKQPGVGDIPHQASGTSALRYLAIVSAARDFGVSTADIERVARRFDRLRMSPRELADALADSLTQSLKA
jgi:hypothetical protein